MYFPITLLLALGCQAIYAATDINPDAQDEVNWILGLQRDTGSFPLSPPETTGDIDINPYFATHSLTNVLKVSTSETTLSAVKKYIQWYFRHTNMPDRFGVHGTIYDYCLRNGREVSRNNYNSTDAYAGTFLTLLNGYLQGSGDRNYLLDNMDLIKTIADSIWATYDSEIQLTRAKPEHEVAYAFHNAEVWRGLQDFSNLLFNLNDPDSGLYYDRAELIRQGIERHLWNNDRMEYRFQYGGEQKDVNWDVYYPDVMTNVFLSATIPEAQRNPRRSLLYRKFQEKFQEQWVNLELSEFPQCWLSRVIELNEEEKKRTDILNSFVTNVKERYYPQRQWPWYNAEAGSFAVILSDQH